MRGKPKFDFDEEVAFTVDGKEKVGKIFIIDKFGTFFDDSDISYDILVESENTLYKHISEKRVRKLAKEG